MYSERIGNYLKIMDGIENLLTKGQIISLLIKETLNALTVRKRTILILNVRLNQRVK